LIQIVVICCARWHWRSIALAALCGIVLVLPTLCGLNGNIIILLCCHTALLQLFWTVWLYVFCCSLTLRIILGYENCSGMFLSKWVFQFSVSLFDKRTRIQAYGALRVLHHPAPGWNCVSATTNTNRNPETNPHNIHPPSLTSHLTYPRPPACLLASGCC